MLKQLLYIFLFLAISVTEAIQQFDISGFSVTCKTGQNARLTGDFPIQDPLQFQYTTQDSYSCLIVQLKAESPTQIGGAKVVILTFEERNKRDPKTRKSITQTPADHGIAGNYQFMYTTRDAEGKNLYGFIDYGNNGTLKNLLEAVKLSRNAMNNEEQNTLSTKAPASFEVLRGYGATVSE